MRTRHLKHATKRSNLGKHKSSATNLEITLPKNQKNTQYKSAIRNQNIIIKMNASNNPKFSANAYQSRIQTRIESGQRASPKKIGENFSVRIFFKTKITQWGFPKIAVTTVTPGLSTHHCVIHARNSIKYSQCSFQYIYKWPSGMKKSIIQFFIYHYPDI